MWQLVVGQKKLGEMVSPGVNIASKTSSLLLEEMSSSNIVRDRNIEMPPPRKNVHLSKFLLVRLYRNSQRKKKKSLRSRTEQGNSK